MAKWARLRSKWLLSGGLLVVGLGCQQSGPSLSVSARWVSSTQPGWHRFDGRLWLTDTLFSGWQYTLHPTGDSAFVGGYVAGRAEGIHRHWYANGRLRESRQYQNGWQEGEQLGWYESGRRAYRYSFRQDVYDGPLLEWYANGQLAREGHYEAGHEQGAQRAWFANGRLKANYEARQGRNYGFTGVKHCVNVRDSIAALY
ncbi:toxin-antitoxin system YwqK family antitoxin [Fibrella aquatilis]|uniref:Membrane-binding protein n=1 Tax=Fibrella aquatilis TaxID=2817059 RepID=A0A939GAU5_9BACT|nr:membrane-binding protein [Fibrella aquatilis]MBO0934408.1 membrane-binding protein [Fibrella aquatilis]